MKDLIQKHFPFKEFRPNQEQIIQTIVSGLLNKPNFIFEGPTGTGKSVIGWTAGKILDEYKINTKTVRNDNNVSKPRILICTSSKQLQKQYVDTFKDYGGEFIWSARNYPCINKHLPPEMEVSYGSPGCLKDKCLDKAKCPYCIQKQKFLKSSVGITNYHYFINSRELNPNVLICDEAHNLQKLICEYNALQFSELGFQRLYTIIQDGVYDFNHSINELLVPFKLLMKEDLEQLEHGKFKLYCQQIKETIQVYQTIIDDQIKTINSSLEDYPEGIIDPKLPDKLKKHFFAIIKAKDSVDNQICKISTYLDSKSQWVISDFDIKKKLIKIKPLDVNEGMEAIMERCNYILFLSATICGPQQFSKELGIKEDSYNYIESPCIFPVYNRHVILNYIGNMNYKNKDEMLPKFVNGIDNIVHKMTSNFEKNISGIIHTVSYSNAEYIKDNSNYKKHILIPTKDDLLDLEHIIKKSKKGLIICSPSIMEGVDLIDDLSRYQIWLKVPYGFLGDRWISTKMKKDSDWYARESIIKLVQGCGRSIRSMDDWAHTFILDSSFNRLLNMNTRLFPKWFLESIITG